MTIIARLSPNTQPTLAFAKEEFEILDAMQNNKPNYIQNKSLFVLPK